MIIGHKIKKKGKNITKRIKLLSATNVIIFITFVTFLIQNSIPNGVLIFGLNIYFMEQSLFFQPLTTIFVHGGIFHLLMNMLVLFQFGNIIEKNLGSLYFIFLYIIGGVTTSLLSFLFIYNLELFSHNLVGASGAISVLFGFYAHRVKDERNAIIIWILLISFAPLLIGINIAWYAHIIGFIIGWLIGFILSELFYS